MPIATRATLGAFYRSWQIMAIDGIVVDMLDTADNAVEFGYSGAGGSKRSAFSQVRILTLVKCGTHATVCVWSSTR